MKKPGVSIFILLTAAFTMFTLGLFIGRNQRGDAISVNVPAVMQTLPPETSTAAETAEETAPIVFPININTATKEEFMALPGIGEVLALRIIAYRQEHGYFAKAEDLMNVEGIGEKRMEDIWELVTTGGLQ